MPEPRLTKSETDRVLAGVCGGIAAYLGIDPVFVRLAFLLLIPSGGIGIPLYIALALIMPNPSSVSRPASEILEQNAGELAGSISSRVEGLSQRPAGPALVAIALIILGIYLLLNNLGWVDLTCTLLGPLLLIGLGVLVILNRRS